MRSVIVCVVLFAVAISADLQSDLNEIEAHLPMEEIEAIGKKYVATFPSYGQAIRFVVENISYDTHIKYVKDFLSSKEGRELVGYFKRYGVNEIESILLGSVKANIDLNRKWLEPLTVEEAKETVISGNMMADMFKALQQSGFLTEVQKKMASSPDLAKFVAAVKNPEFWSRFYRASNSKELFGTGNGPEIRGFWKKVWNVTKGVAVASAIFG